MLIRPLGSFERALFISDAHSPFNVVSVLPIGNCPPSETVWRALETLQMRHPFLRARIEVVDKRPFFAEIDDFAPPFVVLDRQMDDQWLEIAQSELNQHLDVSKGPLFRCHYLVREPYAEVILTFHHTIADATSIVNLMDELMNDCASPKINGVREPSVQLEPASAVEARFPASFHGIGRAWHMLGYVAHQLVDEMRYQVASRHARRPPINPGGHTQVLTMELDQALTEALIRRCRREKVPLNSLLNAAMLMAVNRQLYQGQSMPMRTFSFPDLRPYVAPSLPAENLAVYISMLRYTVQVEKHQSVWEMARALQGQVYRSLKRGDKFIASLMSEGLMKMLIGMKSMRMGTAALSYTGVVDLDQNYGDIQVRGLHGFISNIDLGPEYSAQVNLFADRLIWDIAYLDTDMDQVKAAVIADEIREILRLAV